MNQIMRVGNGVLIVTPEAMTVEGADRLQSVWKERFPEVPLIIIPTARVIELPEDKGLMFEFTGDNITPTFVAEFQKWWEEQSRGT